jgi:hypothetical protein
MRFYTLYGLFPFNAAPYSVQNFNVVTTCEFSICYKIILLFFYNKIHISRNL